MNFVDKNKSVSITLQEEKLLEYFFYSLQKRAIIRKDVKQADFYWNDSDYNKSLFFKRMDGEKVENIDFELNKNELKKYLNLTQKNYIQEIKNILERFSNRKLNYIRKISDAVEDRTILPIKNYVVKIPDAQKEYKVYITLNVEFLYLAIFKMDNIHLSI